MAINIGNSVLAKKNNCGDVSGVSVDLAKFIAKNLELNIDFIVYDSAREVVEASEFKAWDIAFLAIDPLRTTFLSYTKPYIEIEGTYLVHNDSRVKKVDELDISNNRISVGRGAAYDLFLTRSLKHASLIRTDTTPGAVDVFLQRNLDAAAGIRGPLQEFSSQNVGFRVIEDNFMVIRQALAYSKRLSEMGEILDDLVRQFKVLNIDFDA